MYDGGFYGLYYETPEFNLTGYDINASLTIDVATPIPEPAIVLLLSAALFSLAGVNRMAKM